MQCPKQITLCVTSACWARRNRENLLVLGARLAGLPQPCDLRLSGGHCRNLCQQGPNIYIDGKLFTRVTPQWPEQWIRTWLDPAGRTAP